MALCRGIVQRTADRVQSFVDVCPLRNEVTDLIDVALTRCLAKGPAWLGALS